jgi:hypothetical protein
MRSGRLLPVGNSRGGTNMLVTNILLGIVIVFLFIISERLNDMYYDIDEPTVTLSDEFKEFIDKSNKPED